MCTIFLFSSNADEKKEEMKSKDEEEIEQCSKADPFNELLITAMHKLRVDDHSLQEENKVWDIHLEESKLKTF